MHVLLTGASSGIGEALAKAWAARGAKITLVARRKEELDRVAASIPTQTHVEAYDLLDLDGIVGLVERAEAALGPVSALVNNAGMERVQATHDIPIEVGERLLTLNLFAPLRLSRAVLPGMLERGGGSIVDICSVASFSHPPFATYYSASKAGLAAASTSLSDEYCRRGIHVLTVYPGPVDTVLGRRAEDAYEASFAQKFLPWATTEGLATAILKSLDRKRPELVYPRSYAVAKWIPGIARLVMRSTPQQLKDE